MVEDCVVLKCLLYFSHDQAGLLMLLNTITIWTNHTLS
jgi:hypothetical protein